MRNTQGDLAEKTLPGTGFGNVAWCYVDERSSDRKCQNGSDQHVRKCFILPFILKEECSLIRVTKILLQN